MSFKWNLVELVTRYKELSKAVWRNPDDKELYNAFVLYEALLDKYYESKGLGFVPNNEEEDFYEEWFDYEYDFIPSDVIDDIEGADKILKKYEPLELINYPKIKLTNEDLFYIAKDVFYGLKDNEIRNLFDKFTKKDLINVAYSKDSNSLDSFMMYNPLTKTPYAFVYRDNTIKDINRLVHEIGHMLFRYSENYNYNETYKVYLSEVEGEFFDYLSYKKIVDLKLSPTGYKHLINEKILINKINVREFIKNKHLDFKVIDEDEAMNLSSSALSFLVGCDLYNVFKKDKEKGLYDLRKLTNINNKNINRRLKTCDITFFEDNYNNLNKLVKTKKI